MTYSLFSATTPALAFSESQAFTLGFRFTTSASGSVTGLRVFRDNTMDPVTSGLFDALGALLGSVVIPKPASPSWVEATLGAPIPIVAGAIYTAAYELAADFAFYHTGGFFSSSYSSGPLSAVADTSAANDAGGWNIVTSALAFPSSESPTQEWYGNDIVFTPGSTTPPGTPLTNNGSMPIPSNTAWLSVSMTGASPMLQTAFKTIPLWGKIGTLWWGTNNGYNLGMNVHESPELIPLPQGMSLLAWDIPNGITLYVNFLTTP